MIITILIVSIDNGANTKIIVLGSIDVDVCHQRDNRAH